MLALLPRLPDPWPSGYSPLADDVPSRGMSPRNLGQTSNPIVLNSRSIYSPPITSVAGGKSSTQMVSIHSNAGGQPSTQATLSVSGVSTSTRQTSIVGIPTVLFPPTHTTMVNSPSISG